MLQNLSVPKKLILSFMAVIGACGAATLIVLWCVVSLQRADAADLSSREVMKASDRLLAAAVEQQNAMRGYVLTGDPAVLEQYEAGRRDLPARLADDPLLPGGAALSEGPRELTQRAGGRISGS